MTRIFLSYSWDNSTIADELDDALAKYDVEVTRDVRDLEFLDDLERFMGRIEDCDHALVVISPEYLRSANCMNEAIKALDTGDFDRRLVPVFSADCDVFSPVSRLAYVRHWESLVNELNEGIKDRQTVSNLHEILRQLELYETIRARIDQFMSLVSGKKGLTEEQLAADEFPRLASRLGLEAIKTTPKPIAGAISRTVRALIASSRSGDSSIDIARHTVFLAAMDAMRHGAEGRAAEATEALTAFCEAVSTAYSGASRSRCRASIRLIGPAEDGDGHVMRIVARSRNYSGAEQFAARLHQDPTFEAIRSASSPGPQVIDDVSSSLHFYAVTPWPSSIRSMICIPIEKEFDLGGGREINVTAIHGVFAIDSDSAKCFGPDDSDFLKPICDLLYVALRPLQLESSRGPE